MAIDIRSHVFCNLGPVISGDCGDDLLKDTGVIKTTGTIKLATLLQVKIGTRVRIYFANENRNIMTELPRVLRVRKATVDPYRRETTLELGCRLALYEDYAREGDKVRRTYQLPAWYTGKSVDYKVLTGSYLTRPSSQRRVLTNSSTVTRVASEKIFMWPPPPITSSAILNYCCQALGITVHHDSVIPHYIFSRSEVDVSAGYVSVISDLLKSHRLFGQMDMREKLRIRPVDLSGGQSGPTVTEQQLIDIGPITGDNPPANTIRVKYDARTYPHYTGRFVVSSRQVS